jgi:hypothetical protein
MTKTRSIRPTVGLANRSLVADDYADEVSSVRLITAQDLELGVAVEAFAADRSEADPTPVYARPYAIVAGERNDWPREYYLGTRFDTGIIEDASWEEAMREDGASEFVIAKCRRYLRDNGIG